MTPNRHSENGGLVCDTTTTSADEKRLGSYLKTRKEVIVTLMVLNLS